MAKPKRKALSKKGKTIMSHMTSEYGQKTAEHIFYAMRNSGKIKGVNRKSKKK